MLTERWTMTADRKPKVWYFYIDVIWEHGRKHLEEFMIHINGCLYSIIQFTMKVEYISKITFLDTLVERKKHEVIDLEGRKIKTNYIHQRNITNSEHWSRDNAKPNKCHDITIPQRKETLQALELTNIYQE